MAQHDMNIANATFPAVRTDLNNALSAINSMQSGTSRPASAVAGTMWLDTTNATNPTIKFFDGTDDIQFATVNYSANTIDFLDSSLSTPITVTGSSSAGAELRLPEDTDNGSNYVALKAPDTIASNLTFTLPATDGTNGQVLSTNGSGVLSFATLTADGTADWDTSVKTTGFTATANKGYFCNTTSSAFTVTLPATPTAGDEVILVDYAGTWDTNALTINPNSSKIFAQTSNIVASKDRESFRLVYIDSTQGWIPYSGYQEGTTGVNIPYSVDFLVIAGGGGGASGFGNGDGVGGGGAGGYRTSYSTSGGGSSAESKLEFLAGTVYTITVGGGGAGGTLNKSPNGGGQSGVSGTNSSISGTGLTTITSTGGGRSNTLSPSASGSNGGSGGGSSSTGTGGLGTANQGTDGGDYPSSSSPFQAGGGGGSSIAGNDGTGGSSPATGAGGNGTASSITGSSVTRAGGGGGARYAGASSGTGGTGGGGAGGSGQASATGTDGGAGTVNTGSGGGGGGSPQTGQTGGSGGNGGSGVIILRMPTAKYSGVTTGSPTVTTSGSDTILVYNASGTITG